MKGLKDGKEKTVFIYNVADHKEAYNEVGSQGISYTAGVPPVAAAMLVATVSGTSRRWRTWKSLLRSRSSTF